MYIITIYQNHSSHDEHTIGCRRVKSLHQNAQSLFDCVGAQCIPCVNRGCYIRLITKKTRDYEHDQKISYLACSQIWLNLLMDHCHFGYITKLTPKKKEHWQQQAAQPAAAIGELQELAAETVMELFK
jgi:hypothetical protein